MHSKTLLHDLENSLRKAGFSASIKPSGGAQSPNVLAVNLKRDEQGRPRGLVLTLISSVIESMQGLDDLDSGDEAQDSGDGIDFLQYYAELPFEVETAYFAPTAQLITHINKSVPLMGFNMDTVTRAVYFRSMMMFEGENLNSMLVLETVRTIVFLLSEFSHGLEVVASGQQSLDEAIAGLNQTD